MAALRLRHVIPRNPCNDLAAAVAAFPVWNHSIRLTDHAGSGVPAVAAGCDLHQLDNDLFKLLRRVIDLTIGLAPHDSAKLHRFNLRA